MDDDDDVLYLLLGVLSYLPRTRVRFCLSVLSVAVMKRHDQEQLYLAHMSQVTVRHRAKTGRGSRQERSSLVTNYIF